MEKSEFYEQEANFVALEDIQHRPTDLYLSYCGIHHCSPSYYYGELPRTVYLIHIIISGQGIFSIDNQTYNLSAGNAFLIPPNKSEYYYRADQETPWTYMWIGFGGTKAVYYLSKTQLSEECPTCFLHTSIDEIYRLISELLNTTALTLSNDVKRIGLLYHILSSFITSKSLAASQEDNTEFSVDDYSFIAKQYIEQHYAHTSIAQLAEQLNINRTYLHHIFKQKFNISPQEYVIKCRMNEALKLLKIDDFSIKEISENVGYDDPTQFSKLFKKYYGMSPKHYRLTLNNTGGKNEL